MARTPRLEGGGLIVGPDRDALGVQVVHDARTGVDVGRYVDDEDPNPGDLVARELASGHKLVIAGIPQGLPNLRYPGAVNALEWYPFWGGRNQMGMPPPAQAYILQRYFAWPGQRPPTLVQRVRFRRRVRKLYPRRLLLFY